MESTPFTSSAGPSTSPTITEATPAVDVRDMLVVHTALLREFRLLSGAVRRVPVGAVRQAAVVDRHLGFVSDLLHHHHTGEDAHLWPPLRERLPQSALALVEQAESQHAGIEAALERVSRARPVWTAGADAAARDALADAVEELHAALAEHLDAEERTLLPLAAVHLSPREWGAIGEAAAASTPKSAMPLLFGMFSYEGDPEVIRQMIGHAPPPARVVVPRIAPRTYARRAKQVYGTATP